MTSNHNNDNVPNSGEKCMFTDPLLILLKGEIHHFKAEYEESFCVVKDLRDEINRLETSLAECRREKRNTLKSTKVLEEEYNDLVLQDEQNQKILFEKAVLENAHNILLKTVPSNTDELKLRNVKKKYKLYRNFLGVTWDSKILKNKENVCANILKRHGKVKSVETKDCPNIVEVMWNEVEKTLNDDGSNIKL